MSDTQVRFNCNLYAWRKKYPFEHQFIPIIDPNDIPFHLVNIPKHEWMFQKDNNKDLSLGSRILNEIGQEMLIAPLFKCFEDKKDVYIKELEERNSGYVDSLVNENKFLIQRNITQNFLSTPYIFKTKMKK